MNDMTGTVDIICTTDSMISCFLIPYIRLFEKKGFQVKCFCSRTGSYFDRLAAMGIDMQELPFTRNPLTLHNIQAYGALRRNHADGHLKLIFCHEPVGGAVGRLYGKYKKTRVIYMVHGFHFFHGAPVVNWLLFYPVERILSHMTDLLITINQEDYSFAKKHMKAKQIAYLPGVGVDTDRFAPGVCDREKKRQELGLNPDDVALLSVGEVNENKNQSIILDAMCALANPRIHYFIAGVGGKETEVRQKAASLGMEDQVHLLGYRSDCNELYAAADIFCFPSYREGLPVALMEAMSSALPVIASRIRGNVDLVDASGGILLSPDDTDGFAKAIRFFADACEQRKTYGAYNREKVQIYQIGSVLSEFEEMIDKLVSGAYPCIE